jgi:hypothetical protein
MTLPSVPSRVRRRILVDLRWGLQAGIEFAVGYCVIGLVLYLARGPAAMERIGFSIAGLLGTYLVGCMAAGLLAGLMRPVLRTLPGTLIVGFLATAPGAVLAVRIMDPDQTKYIEYGLGVAAMIGPVAAWRLRASG